MSAFHPLRTCDGSPIIDRMNRTTNTIERAFQLAEECASVDEIRTKLKREGFSNVDAHLSGGQIRAELGQIIRQRGATEAT